MKRSHVLAVCFCLFVAPWLYAAETPAITKETVMVPMRDGVLLATDVYRNPSLKQAPVLLMRTPYNKDRVKKSAERFAAAGYVAVVQDCRGKFQSEGVFYPYDNEGRDGYDAIEWLGKQPWCNGRIGMWGASYVGATQWLAANERPPGLVTIAPTATFSSFYRNLYLGGAMRLSLITRWASGNSQKPEEATVTDDWRKTLLHLPMSEIDEQIGWSIPWLEGMLTHPEHDGYWKPTEMSTEMVQLKLPMQHIVGYYDFFSRETVGNFSRMQHWSTDLATQQRQQLILGPWDHGSIGRAKVGDVDFGENAVIDKDGENLKWFNQYLKADAAKSPVVAVPVRYFSMGDNVWQEAQTWPPQGFTPTPFYLHSEGSANTGAGNGRLDYCPPVTAEPADSFKADPADPAPACPVTEKRPLIAATWAPVDQ
ncbi:MAG: CocE/NonD family hydrolase, partial [Planctomycetaceae bacterium]|nr:CocE/NonD family hydrolase [Planctomycetaceae bacterium]